jgi:hypothetical protein
MRRLSHIAVLTLAVSLAAFGQSATRGYEVVVTDEKVTDTSPSPSGCHTLTSSESCHIATKELGRKAIFILRVEALATQPTDGTYVDEGYGQGEFETVKLLEVLKSPFRWTSEHVFWVHPFPGRCAEQDNFSPEHFKVGKSYYLLYTYHLDKEPNGESELIGLTRCGVLADTPEVRAQLIDAIHSPNQK